MPNKELLSRKIAEIIKQLKFVDELILLGAKRLQDDEKTLYLAERVMERLIGAAIDINMHIAKDMGQTIPSNYRESFTVMAKLGVLPEDFAKRIANSVGFRNVLVDEYENIVTEKFFEALEETKMEYKKYLEYLSSYIKRNS